MKLLKLTTPHRILCKRTPHMLLLLAACVACVLSPLAASAQETVASDHQIIALSEIERGMRGYGLSVFSGTERRQFEVEVVGKLENLNPGLSFIMANLSGENLEETGVIGGMSGSPVYLDGRLAGAVAFSWNFAQGALAGITPIEAMRALGDLPSSASFVGAGTDAARGIEGESPQSKPLGQGSANLAAGIIADAELARLLDGDFETLFKRGHSADDLGQWFKRVNALLPQSTSTGGPGFEGASAALQFLTVGFDAQARNLLVQNLPQSLSQRAGASAGRADQTRDLPPLEAGGPVAALLVGGDLLMAVSGTVTERRGDEILAFGHPYLGMGPVSLPMAKAEVVAVVSSRMSSFKLSNVGEVVGAFDEDRLAGMRGQVGAVARTTPMTVLVRHPKEGETRFDLQLADFEPMRPMLIASSALQCIESATRTSGNGGFDLEARFTLKGRDDLLIQQSFDGSSTAIDAAIYLLQVTAFLELTELASVEVESVDLVVDHFDEIRTVSIVDVFADRRTVRAGETINLRLRKRGYRGELRTESLAVEVPKDAKAGSFYLFVGDGVSVDQARSRIEPARDRNFDQGLARLRSLHSAKDLVVLAVSSGRGVLSDGGALPSLPGSLREVWKTSSSGQVKGVSLAVQSERVIRQDVPLSGVGRVDLVVLPPPLG